MSLGTAPVSTTTSTPEPQRLNGDVTEAGAEESDELSGLPRTGTAVLEVRNLRVTFPGNVQIVKGVSFSVAEGESVGIVGESGSGKTMTAMAIARLVPYPGETTGDVRLRGHSLEDFQRRQLDRFLGTSLAVVFQNPTSSLNPALRIGTQLTQPVRAHRGVSRAEAHVRAVSALHEVHIPAPDQQIKRFPHEFSGGMRQRAMIAKGLLQDPALLIADEPTTALDVTIQLQIMEIIRELREHRNMALVLISHNLALISENCDRVLVMYAGRIIEEVPGDRLLSQARHPYTRALINAIPKIGEPSGERLRPIAGDLPNIASPPAGCPYHPRCEFAVDRCRVERPRLEQSAATSRVACHLAHVDAA
jgi:oligopeptide/dipeptide ABC transporter ATP-binding protein